MSYFHLRRGACAADQVLPFEMPVEVAMAELKTTMAENFVSVDEIRLAIAAPYSGFFAVERR